MEIELIALSGAALSASFTQPDGNVISLLISHDKKMMRNRMHASKKITKRESVCHFEHVSLFPAAAFRPLIATIFALHPLTNAHTHPTAR